MISTSDSITNQDNINNHSINIQNKQSDIDQSRNRDPKYETINQLAKDTLNIDLPESQNSTNRALFVFSKNNLIRKAARSIIEWGYPFSLIINNKEVSISNNYAFFSMKVKFLLSVYHP
ncbi:unnamed protein product [Schistosoma intercalatum]|nr:unnamed protein product [Schistosoma intercalatum]CAH8444116.1 unnamed protein product [Schistosoma intercalatum]